MRARNRVEWVRGEQQHLPGAGGARGLRPRALASPRPRRCAGRFTRVTTIHDLNYKLVPDAHFGLRGLGMRRARARPPRAARTASIVDAALDARRPRASTSALPAGQDRRRAARPPRRPRRAATGGGAARALGLGDRAVVLSRQRQAPAQEPRRACSTRSPRIPRRAPPVLVVPGYPTPHEAELRARAAALGVDGRRVLAGLGRGDGPRGPLRAGRRASSSPRCYEGFGLPVLEAMARGVPVACSDRSSLPEVAGDAALLFDPEDVGAIAAAIERLLRDGDLRAAWRARGREQRGRASRWERTARADRRELRAARGPSARRPATTRRSDALERSAAARCAANQAHGRRAQRPRRRRGRAAIASARSSGEADVGDDAVDAVLDELDRGVVGAARRRRSACPARRPRRRPSRSPRGCGGSSRHERAPQRAPRPRAWSTKPGRGDDAAQPARRRSRARPAPRSGPSPKTTPAQLGSAALARERDRGRRPRGARFSGMWRPAKTTTGSASLGSGRRRGRRRTRPPGSWASPRRPSSSRRSRCRRLKQNARWGTRTQARWTAWPTAPPTGPRYSRQ